jgi:ubiquinone/menaquinone biosynthesis C-methylase UbiE
MGCMAMNWAEQGATVTAVDLNPVSVSQTQQRFEVFGLSGDIQQADAEALPFANDQFDYAYSWGVLHHTPGTAQAVEEIRRVLKPGAGIGVMLYHRNSLLYRFTIAYQEGWLNLERRFLDERGLASRYGDGAREEGNPHTWPVTQREVRHQLFKSFRDVRISILGTDILPIMHAWKPGLAQNMSQAALAALARRFGWSLWITARK